ncbi:hypothetical protein [Pararhodonellum marinum]|uniref:hypothetical protein n=1 Tax=Pararhodonellum marinum TaxID=2755358 RepID=UPI00189020E0|nr:hypothetical protein [Pararhodonellum marinum]
MLLSKIKQKFILIPFLLLGSGLISGKCHAQIEYDPEQKAPLLDRMYFGGNFSLQFGDVTFIDISPLAGLMVTPRFSTGLGVTYQYLNFRFFNQSNNIYGGRVFTRYNVFNNIFLHGEYESLNTVFTRVDPATNETAFVREWVPGLFLGGGYFVPFGRRGGANVTLLYNILHDNVRSPYFEPLIIRVGFVL